MGAFLCRTQPAMRRHVCVKGKPCLHGIGKELTALHFLAVIRHLPTAAAAATATRLLLQKLIGVVNNRGFPPESPAASPARPSASSYTNQQQQLAAPAAPGPLFSSVTGLPMASGAGVGAPAAAGVPAMAAAPGSERPPVRLLCCPGNAGCAGWPFEFMDTACLPLNDASADASMPCCVLPSPTAAAWSGWSPLEAAHSVPAGAAPGIVSDEQLARRLQACICSGLASSTFACRHLLASSSSHISVALMCLPGPECCIHLLCLLHAGGVRC